jgi:ribosomal protein L36
MHARSRYTLLSDFSIKSLSNQCGGVRRSEHVTVLTKSLLSRAVRALYDHSFPYPAMISLVSTGSDSKIVRRSGVEEKL